MCGRYTLRNPASHDWFKDAPASLLVPRYNIAPSQSVLVVGRNAEGQRVTGTATWGFRPRWYGRDRKAPINARGETVAEKRLFQAAFRRGRCLVPADGWYEWRAAEEGGKQPCFFHRPDDGLFWFPGLAATDADGNRTMAIITGDGQGVARAVHPRMPIVLPDDAAAGNWLDPDAAASTLQDLLAPDPHDIEAWPVDRAVNRPANDTPDLVRPTGPPLAASA
jgi:putative SOS response-associated peptidase YedK